MLAKGNKERWGYFEKYGEILYDGIKQVMGRIIEGDWKGRVGRQRVSLRTGEGEDSVEAGQSERGREDEGALR